MSSEDARDAHAADSALQALSMLRGRKSTVAVTALAVLVALSSVLVGCQARPRTVVLDDFESGAITGWQAVGGGSGGWLVYADGHQAPDPAQRDPNVPFDVPDPPGQVRGGDRHERPRDPHPVPGPAAGGSILQLSVPSTPGPSPSAAQRPWPMTPRGQPAVPHRPPEALGADRLGGQGRRAGQHLPHLAGRSARRQPTEARLDVSAWPARRSACAWPPPTIKGRCGSGWTTSGFHRRGGDGRVELLATPRPSSAVDLVLHRLPQAQALAALTAHAGERPGR